MIEWIFARMAAGWVKALVVVCACLMPVCAVGWVWEGVSLHGIAIPAPSGFPLYGPWRLVDGAISARDAAFKERDQAFHDRDIYKNNADQLDKGLTRCNAGVTGLAEARKTLEKAAQALVDQRLAEQKKFNDRMAAVDRIKPTDEKCPVVDQIFSTGFGP